MIKHSTEQTCDVSIIIVSYNTKKMTIECLRSVVEQTHDVRYEIIVVDNASQDSSADAVAEAFPDIRLIRLQQNIGFGRANNVAARHAQGNRILLLNPDTLILDSAVDSLLAFAKSTEYCGIWGGRTVFSDGSLNRTSCWQRLNLWNLTCLSVGLCYLLRGSGMFNSAFYGGWNFETPRSVDTVCGCFLLIDRDLWNSLGGFDNTYFMFGEDDDLCYRAHQRGARPTVTPTATIIHHGGSSYKSSVERLVRLMQSKMTLMKRQWSTHTRPVGRFLLLLMPLSRWVSYSVACKFGGRADHQERALMWRSVWRRRAEWRSGYN